MAVGCSRRTWTSFQGPSRTLRWISPGRGISEAKNNGPARGTASSSRRAGHMSWPSSGRFGSSAMPVAAARVGITSIADRVWLRRAPAGRWPGQRITAGTRIPPSKVCPFCPRSGRLSAPKP